MPKHINGILLLDKPKGMTSNYALQKVKRLFNAKKAGHTGSLDPIATGMLPICFGQATKFSQFLLESDKSYYVEAKLGVQTTTGDSEGEALTTQAVKAHTEDEIRSVLATFTGEIEQIPPMYSAIKCNGTPLYKLARQGIEVPRKTRKIKIYTLTFDYLKDDVLAFNVDCSKGTYVRTLVEDIACALGEVAHVVELRRTKVLPYSQFSMYSVTTLEQLKISKGGDALLDVLLPVETSVNLYPAVKLSTAAAFYLKMGQPVRATLPLDSTLVRLLSEDATFLGVGEVTLDGRVKPHRLVA